MMMMMMMMMMIIMMMMMMIGDDEDVSIAACRITRGTRAQGLYCTISTPSHPNRLHSPFPDFRGRDAVPELGKPEHVANLLRHVDVRQREERLSRARRRYPATTNGTLGFESPRTRGASRLRRRSTSASPDGSRCRARRRTSRPGTAPPFAKTKARALKATRSCSMDPTAVRGGNPSEAPPRGPERTVPRAFGPPPPRACLCPRSWASRTTWPGRSAAAAGASLMAAAPG